MNGWQVDQRGTRRHYKDGKLHRDDGPAIEWADGSREWWLDGKLHREDGPAVVWPDGDRWWYRNGKRHREDGPAIEWADGSREWWLDGKLHREDGPAVEEADGSRAWWIEGNQLSEEEFDAWRKKQGEKTMANTSVIRSDYSKSIQKQSMLETIGKRLSLIRINSGMTQTQLAKLANVSPLTVSNAENGNSISLHAFASLVVALKCDANELIALCLK